MTRFNLINSLVPSKFSRYTCKTVPIELSANKLKATRLRCCDALLSEVVVTIEHDLE